MQKDPLVDEIAALATTMRQVQLLSYVNKGNQGVCLYIQANCRQKYYPMLPLKKNLGLLGFDVPLAWVSWFFFPSL